MTNDGKANPKVAKRLPQNPATLNPIYVAAFTEIGPGVDSLIAKISNISAFVAHLRFSTTSFWMMGIIAYPPPKVKAPIFKKVRNRTNI